MHKLPKQSLIVKWVAILVIGVVSTFFVQSTMASDVFPDVPDSHWAHDFISWLFNNGTTSGFPDGTYRPDNPVTRAEMAVFLKKTIHGSSYSPPSPDGSSPFGDIAGHWAEAWIEDLYDEEITSGFPDGTYRPENKVTRAEMAVFLVNVASSYSIEEKNATEYRFRCGGHHFMTLTHKDGPLRTFNLRPHPGVDPDGWGSSFYAQPFLPGATLKHTAIDTLEATNGEGVHVVVSGSVSRDTSSTYGTWSITVDFECTRAEKKITGTGEYTINLEGGLIDTTGDLNLYRISSNYLDDVPLQNGEKGDTGDMNRAEVEGGVEGDGDYFSFTWIPPDRPAHFPIEENRRLSIDVIGECNNVDTLKQGHPFQINPAYKPSIKVVLTSRQDNAKISFGGIYDLGTSQDFASDNVGITPLVKKETTETEFLFDLEFESTALPGDGEPNCP